MKTQRFVRSRPVLYKYKLGLQILVFRACSMILLTIVAQCALWRGKVNPRSGIFPSPQLSHPAGWNGIANGTQ